MLLCSTFEKPYIYSASNYICVVQCKVALEVIVVMHRWTDVKHIEVIISSITASFSTEMKGTQCLTQHPSVVD